MDQQLPQVLVAAFGDADQARLSACRHLAWHQPEPSRQVAAAREGLRVADRSYQCRCVQHANAGDGGQPSRSLVAARACSRIRCQARNPMIQLKPLSRMSSISRRIRPLSQNVVIWSVIASRCCCQLVAPLWHGDAAFQQNGAQLVDQRRSFAYQAIARPVQGLHVELIFALQLPRNAWWAGSLPQQSPPRRGRRSSAPSRRDERIPATSAAPCDPVRQQPAEMMGTAAGLHRDDARRQRRR